VPLRAFKFRFVALLKYRKRVVDRLSLELADLHRRLLEREAEMFDLGRRHSACTADLEERIAGSRVDPELIIMYHNYLYLLGGRIELVRQDIMRLNGQVHDKTKEVVAASKNKKIVEKIRERDMVAFSRLLEDTDRKILDEVGANRASAGRGGVSRIAGRQTR
jgi:flagellar export protein FliJ